MLFLLKFLKKTILLLPNLFAICNILIKNKTKLKILYRARILQCQKKNISNWFSYRRKKLSKQAKISNKPKEKVVESQVKVENSVNLANQMIKQEVIQTPVLQNQMNFAQNPSIPSMSSIPTNGLGFSDNVFLHNWRNIWMANQMQNYCKNMNFYFFFTNFQKYYLKNSFPEFPGNY